MLTCVILNGFSLPFSKTAILPLYSFTTYVIFSWAGPFVMFGFDDLAILGMTVVDTIIPMKIIHTVDIIRIVVGETILEFFIRLITSVVLFYF